MRYAAQDTAFSMTSTEPVFAHWPYLDKNGVRESAGLPTPIPTGKDRHFSFLRGEVCSIPGHLSDRR